MHFLKKQIYDVFSEKTVTQQEEYKSAVCLIDCQDWQHFVSAVNLSSSKVENWKMFGSVLQWSQTNRCSQTCTWPLPSNHTTIAYLHTTFKHLVFGMKLAMAQYLILPWISAVFTCSSVWRTWNLSELKGECLNVLKRMATTYKLMSMWNTRESLKRNL